MLLAKFFPCFFMSVDWLIIGFLIFIFHLFFEREPILTVLPTYLYAFLRHENFHIDGKRKKNCWRSVKLNFFSYIHFRWSLFLNHFFARGS